MATVSSIVLLSLMLGGSLAIPRNYGLSQNQASSQNNLVTETSSVVTDLGELSTNHAVGLAVDPTNQDNIFYADETALYQLDKVTGESSMVAGQASAGLLSMRSSADGTGTSAAFKYITKIIARSSALYIFDYDSLRSYDYSTKEVTTIATLSSESYKPYPITGVVSSDETMVYWTGISTDNGHLVMRMALSDNDQSAAERITGGPTVIGHMEISADGQYLLLADVDMALVEKVRISDVEISFVTKYGKQGFQPGGMAVNGNHLYAINQDERSIGSYDITKVHPIEEPICDKACRDQIVNPLDIAYDASSNNLYILDGAYHPSLPTYIFSIKSIQLSTDTQVNDGNEQDFAKLLQFYSDWFASINQD